MTSRTGSAQNKHSLGDIWARINEQGRAIVGVETKVDAMTTSLATVTNQLTMLAQSFSASQKVQWQPIITFAGVLIAGVSAIGGLVSFGLNAKIDWNTELAREVDRRASENLLLASDNARRELLKQGVALREEMTLRDTAQDVLIDAHARRLGVIEDWQRKNNTSNTAAIAGLKARIEALERRQGQ